MANRGLWLGDRVSRAWSNKPDTWVVIVQVMKKQIESSTETSWALRGRAVTAVNPLPTTVSDE